MGTFRNDFWNVLEMVPGLPMSDVRMRLNELLASAGGSSLPGEPGSRFALLFP